MNRNKCASATSRGVALITALLVVAIATTTVVALTSRQFIDIRRTSNVFEADQAYVYALGIETVAQQLLIQYIKQQGNKRYDDPELMYVPYNFPVEGGTVSGILQDMEAYFNLNTIGMLDNQGKLTRQAKTNAAHLVRIFDTVLQQLQIDQPSGRELVNAVVDWIDANEDVTFSGGAEDSEYLNKGNPYRTPNRWMSSVTELLLIEGFTAEMLYGKAIEKEQIPGLLNYVRALPSDKSKINVNTASAEVLLAFSAKLDRQMIADILEDRPFEKIEDFTKPVLDEFPDGTKTTAGKKGKPISRATINANRKIVQDAFKDRITVQSQFLNVQSSSRIGRTTIQLNSLIHRDNTKIVTISRTQGTGVI